MFQNKKRIDEKLTAYWNNLKAGRPFPLENEIAPEELKDIWDSCLLVRRDEDDAVTFKYIYLGPKLVEAYGAQSTDKEVCETLAYPANDLLIQKFNRVVETKEPLQEDIEFTNQSVMLIKSRTCLLPLGNDSTEEVSYIIGGMRWITL
ncbi:MAG: hypothetical protein CMM93_06495 [Rickettsiales bacterium]|nr:hypothetical protein [Rickettsiales bacterium]|tara:strand:+ start:86 stop:529 length:444 start_codon:yes stop_codon:yes gene_type:complete